MLPFDSKTYKTSKIIKLSKFIRQRIIMVCQRLITLRRDILPTCFFGPAHLTSCVATTMFTILFLHGLEMFQHLHHVYLGIITMMIMTMMMIQAMQMKLKSPHFRQFRQQYIKSHSVTCCVVAQR